jgi:hypothetical protein
MERKDYIDQLRNDGVFKSILENVKDEKEGNIVKYLSEMFLVSLMESLGPLSQEIQNDSDDLKNRLEELEATILTNSDPRS